MAAPISEKILTPYASINRLVDSGKLRSITDGERVNYQHEGKTLFYKDIGRENLYIDSKPRPMEYLPPENRDDAYKAKLRDAGPCHETAFIVYAPPRLSLTGFTGHSGTAIHQQMEREKNAETHEFHFSFALNFKAKGLTNLFLLSLLSTTCLSLIFRP